ncbi:alpha- 16 -fucosyltransferase [Holotrichia oblita]|uniref:Alpha- 16 -fucosyltransferase n=1 Tax=Holotrichia oblita TaxID=644536 RepID=A0ACB9T6T2_HOLOL|nr:alpha- 16 -fucosyltransferase [Holotrichia oblita]
MSPILRQVNAVGCNRILIFFLAIWLVILLFTGLPLITTHVNNLDNKNSERLTRALLDLEALRKQNNELQELFRDIKLGDLKAEEREVIENFQMRLTKAEHPSKSVQDIGFVSQKEEPNTQYELLRRRIGSNTEEFWYFISSELQNLRKQITDSAPNAQQSLTPSIDHILSLGTEHKRSLIHDIRALAENDGYSTWRELEANDLSNIVQSRLRYIQNPPDCKSAKKLVCNLNKGCGYGCQLHHVVYCFLVAYGTERTLILKSKGWRYNKGGWDHIFKPISDSCIYDSSESGSNWPGSIDSQVITLPIIDSISPRPPYLPLSVPEDLAPRLIRLHGDPIVWWVGQFLKYLLRPQEKTSAFLQEAMSNIGFKRPIVGVHVRRTDKVGTEAAYHSIDEYMHAVNEYYDQLELKQPVDKRRVYLATDDPKVIQEAYGKYPHYEILADPSISKSAAVSTRYSESSLNGIIVDIHMLSMSDYLVCTFSSQVCRVAYEIMQNYYPDASDKFRSLDDIYYYGGQNPHNRMAVLPHDGHNNGELSMLPGDLIGVAGNHWNGYSKGKNLRTKQIGLYPSFKVKDKVEIVKLPVYPEAADTDKEEDT